MLQPGDLRIIKAIIRITMFLQELSQHIHIAIIEIHKSFRILFTVFLYKMIKVIVQPGADNTTYKERRVSEEIVPEEQHLPFLPVAPLDKPLASTTTTDWPGFSWVNQ